MKRLCLFAELTVLVMALTQVVSAQTNRYVTLTSTNPVPPYTNWADAATNIQDAISACSSGDVVWVSNGVYEAGGLTNYPAGMLLTNRVVINKAITVRSANNDPTNTIIKGAWDAATNGPAAVRCVYMTNGASLIGFTLTNGATLTYVTVSDDVRGGGVWCQSTNTVISNCVIAGNATSYEGGGAYYGTLYNCTLAGNKYFALTVYNGAGGGSVGGNLYNCILTGNYSGNAGGGAYDCTLYNCTLIDNSVLNNGGGARDCTMYNCTIVGNSQSNSASGGGGGVYGGTLTNCTIVSNSVATTASSIGGGGANSATLYNCLISHNSAAVGWGGGARGCTMYNCTIVSNSAVGGGGVRVGTLYNCISWDNNNEDSAATVYYSCGVGTTYTNSMFGNITNNPLFESSASGNYRPSKYSPCVNTGTNQSWMAGSVDLDGHSRMDKFSGVVDMGCYEYLSSGVMCSVK